MPLAGLIAAYGLTPYLSIIAVATGVGSIIGGWLLGEKYTKGIVYGLFAVVYFIFVDTVYQNIIRRVIGVLLLLGKYLRPNKVTSSSDPARPIPGQPMPSQAAVQEAIRAKWYSSDTLTVARSHPSVDLAIEFLRSRRQGARSNRKAAHLTYLAKAGLVRAGPFGGFLAGVYRIDERTEGIAINTAHPLHDDIVEVAASLVHEIGATSPFNRTHGRNVNRENRFRIWYERKAVRSSGFISITEQQEGFSHLTNNEDVTIDLIRDDTLYHRRSISIPQYNALSFEQQEQIADYVSIEIVATLSRIGAEAVRIGAPEALYNRVHDLITNGQYSRAPSYFSCIYETSFELRRKAEYESADVLPQTAPSTKTYDYRKGRVIGLDVGASDVKVTAFIDGKAIYSKEVNWKSVGFNSSECHLSYYLTLVRLANVAIDMYLSDNGIPVSLGRKLQELAHNANTPLEVINEFVKSVHHQGIAPVRVDAVGLSTAGAVINGRITQEGARVYKGLSSEEFWTKASRMGKRISDALGNVPVGLLNDGDAGALAVAGVLGTRHTLALSLGTGLAAGYVDRNGEVTSYLGEMGKCCIDLNTEAELHEGLRVRGALQQYTSQRGVLRLARAVWDDFDARFETDIARQFAREDGIDLNGVAEVRIRDYVYEKLFATRKDEFLKATGDRPKLRFVQSKLELAADSTDRAKAERIFRTIGYYLSVAIASTLSDLELEHIVLFGACTSGRAGELIVEAARNHLVYEVGDDLAGAINIMLASEEDFARVVGQERSDEFNGEFATRFGQTVGAAYMGVQVAQSGHSNHGEPVSDERLARKFRGSPEYGIHLQRVRLEKGLADETKYHDALMILVKGDSLAYTYQALEAARDVVIPDNSEIYEVFEDSSDDVIAEALANRRGRNSVAVILYVVPDDVPGNLSAQLRALRKLRKAGFDFSKERVAMILAGGDGKRNYPLTPADGYGNKGLVTSLNGEPNLYQAIRQSLQLLGENDSGAISMSTDRIFGITE
ncbi:MAG: hypothetical protein PHV68_09860, partial [Candidatus Gastranaerophilales bacterium]|nr:hypothetical protein [Candidatus Gastranaerophilales bacterium]